MCKIHWIQAVIKAGLYSQTPKVSNVNLLSSAITMPLNIVKIFNLIKTEFLIDDQQGHYRLTGASWQQDGLIEQGTSYDPLYRSYFYVSSFTSGWLASNTK